MPLSIAGLISRDAQAVRADYRVMESVTWFVIIPLCLASVLTGFVSSLGTPLGLFRYYWIVIKVAMTVPSTIVLFVHLRPIGLVSHVAADRTLSGADLVLQIQVVAAAGAAVLVLLAATAVSVYKPRGLTRYGWRKQQEQRAARYPSGIS